jgi:polysaccharide export outer membrane protein
MRASKNVSPYLTAALLIACILGLIPSDTKAQSAGKSSSTQAANADSSRATSADSAVQPGPGYVIGAGDVLSINVWRETEISQKLVVRPDGMITLPLVGDITAMGQTPEQLAEIVSKKLETILTSPQVSVIVAEVHSKFYVVVGEVAKPGQYPLTRPTTVIEAISQAGGFRDFAKTSKMYILRLENGKRVRIPFNYTKVVKGKEPGQEVDLSTGDEIVVP